MAQTTSIKHKGWKWSTADASNPTLVMVLDDTSKAVHITDASDASTDWAVDAATHPTVYIHSATTPATEYLKMYHDATNAYIDGVGATGLKLLVAGSTIANLTATTMTIGVSGTAITNTVGTPNFAVYTTSADASGTSVQPFIVSTVMSGAGGTGGRGLFTLSATGALGGWSNALKALVTYGASGSTSGLGSAFCAETILSAGTTSGTYCALEAELVADSAVSSGTATSFFYCNIAGSNSTGKTTLNTNGYLFELGAGVVDTSSGLFDVATTTPTTVEFDAQLRIRVGGVNYYIPLSADTSFD